MQRVGLFVPEILVSIKQKIKDLWSNLDKSQKVRVYLISAILVVAISASILLVTKSEYVPLISSADVKEIGEMSKILDEKKIPYKVTDDRKSITVDKKNNDKAQAALVQQGYPKSSGMTFDDAFSKIKINSTESDKKKLWDEYMAKNLSSKLKMLENVEEANVTLVMPEQSIFITGNKPNKATASVIVKTKSELTPKQIDGIVRMVASSVQNLETKDVTVVDTNGNVLTTDKTNVDNGTSYQYEMTLKKKSELEKNLRDMFNGRFSVFEGVRVSVNPVLDFNKQKTTSSEILLPEGMTNGAIISRKDVKESITNGNPAAAAPGTATNPGTGTVPTYQTGTGANSNYDKSDLTENFDYTKKQTDLEKSLGDVVSDKTTGAITLLYGDKVKDASGLTPEFLQKIKEIASSSTGIPANNFSVTTLQVNPEVITPPTLQDTISQSIQKYGLFALLALLILGMIIAVIPRKKKIIMQQPAFAEVASTKSVQPLFYKNELEDELPEIQVDETSEVKKQIDKFVKQNPDAVAQLLRNWLADDWD